MAIEIINSILGASDGVYLVVEAADMKKAFREFVRIMKEPYDESLPLKDFNKSPRQLSMTCYMEGLILKLRENNKNSTCGNYTTALHSFKRFLATRQESDIMLGDITCDIMLAYEAYLRSDGVGRNTSSAYMRTLRAVYNRAVEEGLAEQRAPFRRVYTGVGKTVKRSVSLKSIGRIKALDLEKGNVLDYARDMFMLSFYLRGMSFVDMAFLKKTDLKDGYLSYSRRKTGQRLVVRWTSEMQEILDKYPANESCYLLPIIRRPGLNEYCVYRNALERVNKALKTVGKKAGISQRLTHYAARHSWASGARAAGVSLKVISEGMGHDSESTTQIYLASLDASEIDKANDRIIKALK